MSLLAKAEGGAQYSGGGLQGGEAVSAFRAVGSQLAVSSPAVRPATSPLARSPDPARSHHNQDGSPVPSSTDGDSQPCTPVVPGPPLQQGQDAFSWPSHSHYDENRELLGTEEESSEVCSEEEEEERSSSWLITREQLSYYQTQFRTMQPNPAGVIPGTQAKEFFEKSRLPIQELRQIWQLSDVTKDGCLSLEEFLTAMHLVVLRRNDIPLPEELPPCLHPANLQLGVVARHNRDLYGVGQPQQAGPALGPASPPSPAILSSPGSASRPKPVKFDFAAVSAGADPAIACPVPLRLSPDSPCLRSSSESPQTVGRAGGPGAGRAGRGGPEYEQLWDQHRLSSASSSASGDTEDDCALDALSSSHSNDSRVSGGPVSLPHFAPEPRPLSNILGLQKKEGLPPSPPPRPGKSHTRSASLDLNQMGRGRGGAPPSLPPRTASPCRDTTDGAGPGLEEGGGVTRDGRQISASIHKFKESIALLSRALAELGQEVNDTVEERVVLEYQLDQLKSIGNDEN